MALSSKIDTIIVIALVLNLGGCMRMLAPPPEPLPTQAELDAAVEEVAQSGSGVALQNCVRMHQIAPREEFNSNQFNALSYVAGQKYQRALNEVTAPCTSAYQSALQRRTDEMLKTIQSYTQPK